MEDGCNKTDIDERLLTPTDCFSKPSICTTIVSVGFTFNVAIPFMSVAEPIVVPFTTTEAPGKTEFVCASITFIEMVF